MEYVLEKIRKLNELIQNTPDLDDPRYQLISEIEEQFTSKIPNDIKSFLLKNSDYPEDILDIFMGYEPLTLEDLIKEYRNISTSMFFQGFGVDENLRAAEEFSLTILTSLEGEAECDTIVNDLKRVIPLFDGIGFYIGLFENDTHGTEIITIGEDYTICSLAPSLTAHLLNLEEGLTKNIFYIDDEQIIMPTSWHQRVKALSAEGLDEDEWDS